EQMACCALELEKRSALSRRLTSSPEGSQKQAFLPVRSLLKAINSQDARRGLFRLPASGGESYGKNGGWDVLRSARGRRRCSRARSWWFRSAGHSCCRRGFGPLGAWSDEY